MNKPENYVITFKQAQQYKAWGYDEPALAYYDSAGVLEFGDADDPESNKNSSLNEQCTAPLYWHAIRWLLRMIDKAEGNKPAKLGFRFYPDGSGRLLRGQTGVDGTAFVGTDQLHHKLYLHYAELLQKKEAESTAAKVAEVPNEVVMDVQWVNGPTLDTTAFIFPSTPTPPASPENDMARVLRERAKKLGL
jgi:hypothetical protein